MSRISRVSQITYIVFFFGALWFPILQMHFVFFEEFEEAEKRELAKPPPLTLSALGDVPRQFNSFAADNFGFRPNLIRWNSILKTQFFGISPIPSVIVGKNSWLFYCSEALADGNTMNDFRGTIPLPESELIKLQRRLEENQQEFEKRNIVYLVVIVPNKNTIYGEFLPDNIRKFRPTTRLDQLISFIEHRSKVKVVDLRERFHQGKGQYPLYWKTDSHWNSYGAYVGYLEIMKHLSRRFSTAQAVHISDGLVKVERNPVGGDLAQMLFMQDMLPEDNETKFGVADTFESKPLNTLLFRHDSFGDNLYPFLHRHFRRIVNVAPFTTYKFDKIDEERPDVVLHVFAERYITQALHDDFFYGEGKM